MYSYALPYLLSQWPTALLSVSLTEEYHCPDNEERKIKKETIFLVNPYYEPLHILYTNFKYHKFLALQNLLLE